LVLGTSLIAAMGLLFGAIFDTPDRQPQRFTHAQVVVHAGDPQWNPATHELGTRSLSAAKGLDEALISQLQKLGPIQRDYAFYAQLAGSKTDQKDRAGHGWSAAALGSYSLQQGRAPAAATEIVVSSGQAALGSQQQVITAEQTHTYTVVGLVNASSFETPIFFSDAQAAAIAQRVNAVAIRADPQKVEQLVGDGALVLSGNDRHQADPSYVTDSKALGEVIILLPIMATVTGFVAVFVVASTFAFGVAQRRREIALLHVIGATSKQLRSMLFAEAWILGIVGAATGCILGYFLTPYLARWLVSLGVAPSWYGVGTAGFWTWLPLIAAFLCGLGVALAGVWTASRRAGQIRATEALREADVDNGMMTTARWVAAITGLLAVIGTLYYVAIASPGIVLKPTDYVPFLLVPVLAFAIWAPVLAAPLTKLLTWPLLYGKGALGLLLRQSTLSAIRRTNATAAPILLTIGLAASLLTVFATTNATRDSQQQAQFKASYILSAQNGPGLNQALVSKLQQVPGVVVLAPLQSTIYIPEPGESNSYDENDLAIVDPAALQAMSRLQLTAGSLQDLDHNSIVVADRWGYDLGQTLNVVLGDGTSHHLRIAAIVKTTRGTDIAYLTTHYASAAKHTGDGLVGRIYVSVLPDSNASQTLAQLQNIASANGAIVSNATTLQSSQKDDITQANAARQNTVLLLVLLFCFVAIINTLVMASSDRIKNLALLRLAGATPRQILAVTAAEAALVSLIGIILAIGATLLNLAGLAWSLQQIFGTVALSIPWAQIMLVTAISIGLAQVATLVPAWFVLSGRRLIEAGRGKE
jgi:putative ABC transport system permease protein